MKIVAIILLLSSCLCLAKQTCEQTLKACDEYNSALEAENAALKKQIKVLSDNVQEQHSILVPILLSLTAGAFLAIVIKR